jgi:hypothetical protein
LGVVLVVLEVFPAVGCVVAALPFGCAVVVAAGVVVLDAGVVVVLDGALVVPFGCGVVLVEAGVIGATVSPGFGKGFEVMPAINSLRPASEPLLRYL